MEMEAGRRVRLVVRGRVQGVGFRAYAAQSASRASTRGWVHNCSDGSLECVFEGTGASIREVLMWMRKGPPGSVIDAFDIREESPRGEEDFEIRPATAMPPSS